MDKVHHINTQRLRWCLQENALTVEQLARKVDIAEHTLTRAVDGDGALTVKQLRKLADFFNRGLLFFVEEGAVDAGAVYTPQFRTISSQKPGLGRKLRAVVERVERQRAVYLSLLEELGEDVAGEWLPGDLAGLSGDPVRAASRARQWLALDKRQNFGRLRDAVEGRGILVFVSNGYAGDWQIPKTSPVRGFSLHHARYPVIFVRKQQSGGAQAFTLAHELGHLVLHGASFIDDADDLAAHQGREQQANQFAGHLLVPTPWLDTVDLADFPREKTSAYDPYLKDYADGWGVSAEVVLRRLVDERRLPTDLYRQYRAWKATRNAVDEKRGGGMRYRHREPVRIFGRPYVGAVLDALEGNYITLSRASSYLDNLKIQDVRRLEHDYAHV